MASAQTVPTLFRVLLHKLLPALHNGEQNLTEFSAKKCKIFQLFHPGNQLNCKFFAKLQKLGSNFFATLVKIRIYNRQNRLICILFASNSIDTSGAIYPDKRVTPELLNWDKKYWVKCVMLSKKPGYRCVIYGELRAVKQCNSATLKFRV